MGYKENDKLNQNQYKIIKNKTSFYDRLNQNQYNECLVGFKENNKLHQNQYQIIKENKKIIFYDLHI